MTEAKKKRLRERQIELLKMFKGDFYQVMQVGNEWYIKSWNGGTNKWQVSVYSDVSYKKYKSFDLEKAREEKELDKKFKDIPQVTFERPTLESIKKSLEK